MSRLRIDEPGHISYGLRVVQARIEEEVFFRQDIDLARLDGRQGGPGRIALDISADAFSILSDDPMEVRKMTSGSAWTRLSIL